MKYTNMKPFNLEEAKQGKPVCTRSGIPVCILAYDLKSNYPIVGVLSENDEEAPFSFTSEGLFVKNEKNKRDLMMAEEIVNINGHQISKPVSQKYTMKNDMIYYVPCIKNDNLYHATVWHKDADDISYFTKGLVHLTKENAIAHTKALLSFTSL